MSKASCAKSVGLTLGVRRPTTLARLASAGGISGVARCTWGHQRRAVGL